MMKRRENSDNWLACIFVSSVLAIPAGCGVGEPPEPTTDTAVSASVLQGEGHIFLDWSIPGYNANVDVNGPCQQGPRESFYASSSNRIASCWVNGWVSNDPYDCRINLHYGIHGAATDTCNWFVYSDAIRPANDDFAAATVISALPAALSGTTANATREVSEPDHYTENKPDAGWWLGDHSVWYQWTARSNALVTVDVCTGGIDSIVAVYSGSALDSLSRIIDNNNDNCGGGWGAKVMFTPTPGVNYHIAVADAGSAQQNTFTLRMSAEDPVTVCGNGVVESGERCDDGNNYSFDQCSPDCHHACAGAQVWCDCVAEACMTQAQCFRQCRL